MLGQVFASTKSQNLSLRVKCSKHIYCILFLCAKNLIWQPDTLFDLYISLKLSMEMGEKAYSLSTTHQFVAYANIFKGASNPKNIALMCKQELFSPCHRRQLILEQVDNSKQHYKIAFT